MVMIIIEKIDHVLAPLELGWSDLQTTLDCDDNLYLWRVDPSNLSSLVGELFVTCTETIKVAENMKEIILTDSNDQFLSEVGSLRSNISDLGAGLEESLAVTAGFRVWDDNVSFSVSGIFSDFFRFQGYSQTFSDLEPRRTFLARKACSGPPSSCPCWEARTRWDPGRPHPSPA